MTRGNRDDPVFPGVLTLPFPKEFELCLAAPNPVPGMYRYVFGSTTGDVRFTDGTSRDGKVLSGKDGREAINGVAYSNNSFATSSRGEIVLRSGFIPDAKHVDVGVIHGGAHSIAALPSGGFVAPRGNAGLLLIYPEDKAIPITNLTSEGPVGRYYYRAVAFPGPNGADVIACANRREGVGFTVHVRDHVEPMAVCKYEAIDVVDVCPIRAGDHPGVVALGRDGTTMLFPNTQPRTNPVTLKFNAIEGTAYRVLVSCGHLFLLTSRALYMLAGLIDRFLNGGRMDRINASIFVMPMDDAVDASICHDQYVAVVAADSNAAHFLDIQQMEASQPRDRGADQLLEERPVDFQPRWESHEYGQHGQRSFAGQT
jgi:hypothetical protein